MIKNLIHIANYHIRLFLASLILIAMIGFEVSAKDLEGRSYKGSDFYVEGALSVEYNAPRISGAGDNKKFSTTNNLFKQIYDLENIALGVHIRFHDSFGLNVNWVQTNLDSIALQQAGPLAKKAIYKIDHYNFSLLTYAPIVKNFFELFAELGASDIRSDLSYTLTNGNSVNKNSHETRFFYGGGMQIYLNNITSVRFSAQRYVGNIGLINSDYTTVRIGFLRFF